MTDRRWTLCAFLMLMLWALPSLAEAQAQPGAVAPSTEKQIYPATDLVRLVNGGLVRGLISEYIPGKYVEIVTVHGAARRFEAAAFTYAGPASEEPESGRPNTQPAGESASPSVVGDSNLAPLPQLRFQQEDADADPPLTLYVRETLAPDTGSGASRHDGYRALCTAPCYPDLAPGTYTLGIAPGTAHPAPIREVVGLDGNERLVGGYRSRIAARVVGVLLSLAAATASIALTATSSGDKGKMYLGLGLAAGGFMIGLPLTFVRPQATLAKYVPASAPAP